MNKPPEMSLAQQLAAAQEWWRGAGVDFDFHDEAQTWLAKVETEPEIAPRPVVEKEPEAKPEPIKPLIEPSALPDTLDGFQDWWMAPESPIPGAIGKRIAPRGVAGAKLMVVVPAPEPHDGEQLLSGAQGKLVSNILRALSLAEGSSYLASALPCTMAEPDWMELQQQGLGHVLTRHIHLVKPQRVLLLGRGLPLLLGHAADAPPEAMTAVDSPEGKLPILTSFAPDRLLGHARQRARLWHRLLDWME